MKILATGGTGYIGSHVVVDLLDRGYDVEVLDNLSNSKLEALDRIEQITHRKPRFHQVDLRDQAAVDGVMRDGRFDLIVHFAGLKSVSESVEQPMLYYDNNLGGTINLLVAAQKYNVKRFVFSSSATVYGAQKTPVCTEDLETGRGITSPYGETKYMIEKMLKDLAAAWTDFGVVCLRYFNPVGNHPSGLLGESPNGIPNNLMPYIMKVATGELAELSIFGHDYDTPDGTCQRDYIHVADLAEGHLAAIRALKPGFQVFNLGTGRPTSVLEMVHAFEKVSGRPLPYRFAPRRSGDLPATWADPSKAEKVLGWHATRTIEDAMRDTLAFIDRA